MAVMTESVVGDIEMLARSWKRDLEARNLSPRTVRVYTDSVAKLTDYLAAQGMPTNVAGITREHVSAFIADQLERRSASTAATRFTGCRVFFGWLVEDGELKASPMERMKKPQVPERITDIPDADDLKRLLKSLDGNSHDDLRDLAIIRVFMSTGARLAEVAGLQMEDVDLDRKTVTVIGKGNRQRTAYLDAKAVRALDRYIRKARSQRTRARSPWLWLGQKKHFTESGIGQMVRKRARAVGFELHAHQLRHWRASEYKASGMADGHVMALMGWKDPAMVRRYGKQNEAQQALEMAARLDAGDL